MRKNIFNIASVLVAILVLFSCSKFEPEEIYYDSVLLDLSDKKMSVLDDKFTTTIDFVSKTKKVSNVVLLVGGKQVLSTTASGNKVSVSLKRSDLGLKKIGDEAKLHINATVDGRVKEMYTIITMVGAMDIKVPMRDKLNDKGEVEKEEDPVYQLSNVVKNFTYGVHSTLGVNVTAEQKVGENGTFAALWTKEYNKEDAKVAIKGADFTVNDTVFVRLIAKSSAGADTVSANVVIEPYMLSKFAVGKVDVKNKGFDLLSDALCSVSSDSCKLEFTHDFSKLYQGFKALNSTSFVKITDTKLQKCVNLPKLKAAFDAESTALTDIENVKVGDFYIVKVVNKGKDYYGKITVKAANTNRKSEDDFVEFEYGIVKYDIEQ